VDVDPWATNHIAFQGGPGGEGPAAWSFRPRRAANAPLDAPGRTAMRAAISTDARLAAVDGAFDRAVRAAMDDRDRVKSRPYYANEDPEGKAARLYEWQQMAKDTQIVRYQPGLAAFYDALIELVGLGAALDDTRPGAVAQRLHELYKADLHRSWRPHSAPETAMPRSRSW